MPKIRTCTYEIGFEMKKAKMSSFGQSKCFLHTHPQESEEKISVFWPMFLGYYGTNGIEHHWTKLEVMEVNRDTS